ncbi:hypothetical protein pb186bvf_014450 [Paramecium bursaria]
MWKEVFYGSYREIFIGQENSATIKQKYIDCQLMLIRISNETDLTYVFNLRISILLQKISFYNICKI